MPRVTKKAKRKVEKKPGKGKIPTIPKPVTTKRVSVDSLSQEVRTHSKLLVLFKFKFLFFAKKIVRVQFI